MIKALAGFVIGAAAGSFFTWLAISMLIVDRALSQTHEES